VALGDDDAAKAFLGLRETSPRVSRAYSGALARLAARAFHSDPLFAHAFSALIRHARLIANRQPHQRTHQVGAWLKQIAILLRLLRRSPHELTSDAELREEIGRLEAAVAKSGADPSLVQKLEDELCEMAERSSGRDGAAPASGADARQESGLEGLRKTAS
jgi:hypothetical protein